MICCWFFVLKYLCLKRKKERNPALLHNALYWQSWVSATPQMLILELILQKWGGGGVWLGLCVLVNALVSLFWSIGLYIHIQPPCTTALAGMWKDCENGLLVQCIMIYVPYGTLVNLQPEYNVGTYTHPSFPRKIVGNQIAPGKLAIAPKHC